MTTQALASNVKRLRLAAGFTQAELANKADIHRRTLLKIEQAEANPTLSILTALANALNTTPAVLLEAVMTKPYTIRNSTSSHTFGVYMGEDELDAYRALCEDARHYETPCEIPSEILVEEVEE